MDDDVMSVEDHLVTEDDAVEALRALLDRFSASQLEGAIAACSRLHRGGNVTSGSAATAHQSRRQA